MLAAAALAIPDGASAAPSREDEATDALYGNTSSDDEAPREAPPKEEPRVIDERPSEPKPTAEPRTVESGPTSSRAPGSDRPIESAAPSEPEPEPEPAATEPTSAREEGDAPRASTPRGMSHYRQGSLSVMPGWGFSAIVPYQKRIFCGEFSDDPGSSTKRKSFCTMGTPWFIEFTAGYGIHPRIDLVLGVRVHVQKRDYRCRKDGEIDSCKGMFNDSLAVGLAPGIRAWISDPERIVKIGAAVDFIWLHESFRGYRRRGRCEGRNDTVNGPCPVEEPLEGYEAARSDEAGIGDDDIGFRLGPVLQVDPHRNIGIFLMPAARMGLLRWFEFSFDIALGVQARFP